MDWPAWLIIFGATFVLMELAAWALHKYVMHGFLWSLHRDHHVKPKNQKWERNDLFALFFSIPSFLFILADSLWKIPWLGAIGFGIMAYGGAYFLIHEVIIHRRVKLIPRFNNWYLEALNSAHKLHHSNLEKYNSVSFSMLVVSLPYFKKAWRRNRKR
ncbi:MAG: sterol desaturase family protein [Bacteriovorax sp.]|nr:sterol desaturase family protein [Bacteriovorax sp.]